VRGIDLRSWRRFAQDRRSAFQKPVEKSNHFQGG
jgi:hypothetical protein